MGLHYKSIFIAALVYIFTLVRPETLLSAPIAYVYSATGQFGTVNLVDGSFQSLPSPDILVADLNTSDGQPLYVIDSDITSNLRTLNSLTGQTTLIGNTSQLLQGIEVNLSGLVFGQSGNSLYSLSSSTGISSLVGEFGTGLNFDFAQGAFNNVGTLYMVGHKSEELGTSLYRVDPLSGTATLIGPTNFLVETILFADGTLYGFTGSLSSPNAGPIIAIDPQTGITTVLVNQDPNLSVVVGAGTQFATVPEPGTSAGSLAGMGIIALAIFGRRRILRHS